MGVGVSHCIHSVAHRMPTSIALIFILTAGINHRILATSPRAFPCLPAIKYPNMAFTCFAIIVKMFYWVKLSVFLIIKRNVIICYRKNEYRRIVLRRQKVDDIKFDLKIKTKFLQFEKINFVVSCTHLQTLFFLLYFFDVELGFCGSGSIDMLYFSITKK